jgi:hypothetical protein
VLKLIAIIIKYLYLIPPFPRVFHHVFFLSPLFPSSSSSSSPPFSSPLYATLSSDTSSSLFMDVTIQHL